jgi:hypothetical protein
MSVIAIIILVVGLAYAFHCFFSANRIEESEARALADWEALPTIDQYLEGTDGSGRGCRCTKCGSNSMRNRGLFSSADPRRQFNCNHCGTVLYRNTTA